MRAAVLALAAACAACRSGAPSPPEPSPSAAPPALAASSAPAARGRVRIVEAPADGAVAPVVRDALRAASPAPGGPAPLLLVYVGAAWCEPCRRFHEAAARGDLDATFPGMTLLEFDLDRDRERLAAAGYVSRYIPLFALPASDGTASGKQVEGGIKGEGAVGFIVPRLKALVGGA